MSADYLTLILFFISLTIIAIAAFFFGSRKIYHQKVESIQTVIDDNQEWLNLAFETTKLGLWEWNVEKDKIYWNHYMYQIFGIKEFKGTIDDLVQLIYPLDRELFLNCIKKDLASSDFHNIEFRINHSDGTLHLVNGKGKIFRNANGQVERMVGICQEITETKLKQKLLEIQYIITKNLSESTSIKEAIPKLLSCIGYNLGWDIVGYWKVDADNRLRCVEMWQSHLINGKSFIDSSKSTFLKLYEGFPGSVFINQIPTWYRDVLKANDFQLVRKTEAQKLNLKGAIAFPIIENSKVVAVIEMFKTSYLNDKLDNFFLNTIDVISREVGLFLKRLESEEEILQMASIVKFSKDAIISVNTDSKIQSWNQGAVDLYGYDFKSVLNQPIDFFIPDEMKGVFQKLLNDVMNGKPVNELQTIHVHKNGQKIWVLQTCSPLKNQDNQITGACLIGQNIELIKKFEDKLKTNEEKFRSFVETTSDWIWTIDSSLKFTFTNQGVELILGYDPKEILGVDYFHFMEEKEKQVQVFDKLFLKKKGWTSLVRSWRHKNGESRFLESNAEVILDKDDKIIGYRGADRDITERIKYEKIKNEFISIVSHELRTPLTSIRGGLALVLARAQNDLSEKSKQLLTIASNNCDRLSEIINEILDVQKLESGAVNLNFQILELGSLVEQSIKANSVFADKYQVNLLFSNLAPGVKVKVDPKLFMQVMDNLLSNAIKYSSYKSNVSVFIKQIEQNVLVSIKDHGKGIPQEFQSRIFSKFSQADTTSTRSMPGTGLGLYITKNILEKHGSEINFISVEGEGTEFYFTLPIVKEPILNEGLSQ